MEFMLFASNKANPNKIITVFFRPHNHYQQGGTGLAQLVGGVCDDDGDVDGGDGSVGYGGGGDGDGDDGAVGHLPKHEDLWKPRPHLPA